MSIYIFNQLYIIVYMCIIWRRFVFFKKLSGLKYYTYADK